MDSIQNLIDEVFAELTEEAQKELIRNYKKALDDLRKKIALIYEKYAQAGELTFAEMSKYNRYDELIRSIEKRLSELGVASKKITLGLAGDIYQESYYRTAFFFEYSLQAKLGYGILNGDVIKAAVQNPISGLTLNQTLEKNRAVIVLKIKQEITQGLIKGEPYSKMAARFKSALGGDVRKAITIAQTEAHRCQSLGTLASGQRADSKGVDIYKVWDATLDAKTRPSHQALDQKKVKIDEDFISPVTGAKGAGPGLMGNAADDINCRCALRHEIKGYAPKVRYSRDEEGKRGKIIPYTNYQDWMAAKGLKIQKV